MTRNGTKARSAADLEHSFPSWEVSAGPDGRFHARLRRAKHVQASANDPAELCHTLSRMYDADSIAEALLILRCEVRDNCDWADQMSALQSRRISALEEALSARWPRRQILRLRLASTIRKSARRRAGMSWHDRRAEYVFEEWLSTR
jgi:hypothetical protein